MASTLSGAKGIPTQSFNYLNFPFQDEYVVLTHFPTSNELNFEVLRPLGTWTWIGFYGIIGSAIFFICVFMLLFQNNATFKIDLWALAMKTLFQYQH